MKAKLTFAIIKSVHRHAVALFLALGLIGAPRAPAADYYAAQNGQTPGDYTTWANAASNIQDAVNAANTNDTVWVGAGHYTVPADAVDHNGYGTNVVYIGKPLTLRSSNGVPATTVIDGGGACRGVNFWYTNANTPNRFVLDGFTISNCYATNTGGGLLFFAYSARWTGEVRNCVISDNIVAWGTNSGITTPSWSYGSKGGGIYCLGYPGNAGFIISNCTIRNNQALPKGPNVDEYAYGGGIWSVTFGARQISGCRIESNSATVGGGCYLMYGYATTKVLFENCTFNGNRTVDSGWWNKQNVMKGGGINFENQGYFICRNVLFNDNYSVGYGGAINSGVTQELYNCAIVNNQLDGAVGQKGSAICTATALMACNTIIYSNAYCTNEIWGPVTNAFFTNCCMTMTNMPATGVTNDVQGAGNFFTNPMVLNWAGQDYHLQADSPCVNRGFNQAWMTGAFDLDGHARIDKFSGIVDVGCYEYLHRGVVFTGR